MDGATRVRKLSCVGAAGKSVGICAEGVCM